MSDKERALWQAISRGLKLIVNAIDAYIKEPGIVRYRPSTPLASFSETAADA